MTTLAAELEALGVDLVLEAGRSDRAIGRELGCAAATVARGTKRLGLRRAA
ncbi:MAG TPA: hypothetical protein VKM54_03515 [Myxococcota bacterium]|nr:hypothetical protein [Myxococcota bacterium]